jgi:hypothetical protein
MARVEETETVPIRRRHPLFLAATILLVLGWMGFLAWLAFR